MFSSSSGASYQLGLPLGSNSFFFKTGDVVNYVTDPACVDTKLSKGRMLATRQTTFQTMIVAATTGSYLPSSLYHPGSFFVCLSLVRLLNLVRYPICFQT